MQRAIIIKPIAIPPKLEITMDNVQIELKDNQAVITIDLSKDFGPSKSGKTIVVATTRGNVPIPGAETIRLGLNCYKYPEENK